MFFKLQARVCSVPLCFNGTNSQVRRVISICASETWRTSEHTVESVWGPYLQTSWRAESWIRSCSCGPGWAGRTKGRCLLPGQETPQSTQRRKVKDTTGPLSFKCVPLHNLNNTFSVWILINCFKNYGIIKTFTTFLGVKRRSGYVEQHSYLISLRGASTQWRIQRLR